MKRTLYLIRHAKSSWDNIFLADFDRTLNERGRHDAPMMGERLKQQGIQPDLIICSAARRTVQTAKSISRVIGYDEARIIRMDRLYHCIPEVLEEVISSLEDSCETVFIVAHNPGITQFVNELSDTFRIDNMPTCGIVGASFEGAEWEQFRNAVKTVFYFDYPKKNNQPKD